MSNPKQTLTLYGLMLGTVSIAGLLSAFAFPIGPKVMAPSLGRAWSFAVLGGSTVTNSGYTVVAGNLGVSPGTAITGFTGIAPGGPELCWE